MIDFIAYYHSDATGVSRIETSQWESLPVENLLFVDVMVGRHCHRLLGADFYWFKDNRYGMIYDGSCCDAKKVSWIITKEYEIIREESYNEPESVHLLVGKLLFDDEWYRIEDLLDQFNVLFALGR